MSRSLTEKNGQPDRARHRDPKGSARYGQQPLTSPKGEKGTVIKNPTLTAVRKDSIGKLEAVGLSKAVATVIVAVIVAIATVIVSMRGTAPKASKPKASKASKAPKAPKAEKNILSTVLRTGEEKKMSLDGFRKSAAWTAEAEASLLDGQTVSTPYKTYRLVKEGAEA
ncbi:MAG: hypothetical protein M0P69_18685 [Bacteroidales bacterium]|nr:hypothetical protein [Bacteroidales bacterium]